MRVLSTYDENKPLIPGPPRQLLQEGWRGDKVTISRCDLPSIPFSWILSKDNFVFRNLFWAASLRFWRSHMMGRRRSWWWSSTVRRRRRRFSMRFSDNIIVFVSWSDELKMWKGIIDITLLVEEPFLLDQLRGSFTELAYHRLDNSLQPLGRFLASF